jgi:uncharacterized membrane protein YdjX (TVP38/TMEM64 family)
MSGEPPASSGQAALGPPRRALPWRPLLLGAALLAAFVAARALGVGERILALQAWIRGLGPAGYLVFAAIYTLGVVAALPGSAITVLAGALFGSVGGVVLVSLSSTAGACLAFLIARYAARDAVSAWLGANEKFRRLDELTAQRGAAMVAFTRLVPLFPFNLLNYGFGLTRVPFTTYAFWSWLCMLPATVVFVVGADAASGALAGGGIPWRLAGVAAAALLLLVLLGWWVRGRMRL